MDYRNELSNDFLATTEFKFYKKPKSDVEYCNTIFTFDIETSSFYVNKEKHACLVCWQACIEGTLFLNRTWNTFKLWYDCLCGWLHLNLKHRIIIYVHNLSYEFQWLSHRLTWDSVFCVDKRKVLYAVTTDGVEFRCSYLLSGVAEKNLHTMVQNHTYEKTTDWDYTLLRNSKTVLTEKEIEYALIDVYLLYEYIKQEREANNYIYHIPYTKTGYVRRFIKEKCFQYTSVGRNKYLTKESQKFQKLMSTLTITDSEEYNQLKRCYTGGFTHADITRAHALWSNVKSQDLTSSYPAVMCCEYVPMSAPRHIDNERANNNFGYFLDNFCCMFDIELIGVHEKFKYEHYLSLSKCFDTKNPVVDNGRIIRCDYTVTTLNEIDFKILSDCYYIDDYVIHNLVVYNRGYLPKPIINSVLEFYEGKTLLKPVKDTHFVEYQSKKGMTNSVYGMFVTDIVKDLNTYLSENDMWVSQDYRENEEIVSDLLNDYNKNKERYLYYPWGVWITSHARFNLWSAIFELGSDYIYSDTDSVKYLNYEKHERFFEEYNNNIREKMDCVMNQLGIEPERTRPLEIQLGAWTDEGVYKYFKTLGAKRYFVQKQNGKYELTMAGVSKEKGCEYLCSFSEPFDVFSDGLEIPKECTGKQTVTYIDKEVSGTLTDYNGVTAPYHEYSCIHMVEQSYKLSLSEEYLDVWDMINSLYSWETIY